MSEETSWLDGASDWLSEAGDRLEQSVTHSARLIEDAIDTDDDGSLLDDLTGGALEESGIPVISQIGGLTEEVGDFATDLLGTRHEGVFSEAGTYDEGTSDRDYAPGSGFEQAGGGFGQFLNESLGVGQNDPGEMLAAVGSPVGLLAEAVDQDVDQYEQADEDGYVDYDPEQE